MSKQYEFVKAEQRSPEWFALRADGITATDVSVIAGLNPYKTPYQLWAEKLGKFTLLSRALALTSACLVVL